MRLNNDSSLAVTEPDIRGDDIARYEGKDVCVFWRHGFHTTISIRGRLEIYSQYPDRYRVLVNNDTYTYFTLVDVVILSCRDNKRPNIALKCHQTWSLTTKQMKGETT